MSREVDESIAVVRPIGVALSNWTMIRKRDQITVHTYKPPDPTIAIAVSIIDAKMNRMDGWGLTYDEARELFIELGKQLHKQPGAT